MEGQRVDMLHPAAYRLARPSTPLVAAHAGSGAGFEPPREERDDPSLSLSLSGQDGTWRRDSRRRWRRGPALAPPTTSRPNRDLTACTSCPAGVGGVERGEGSGKGEDSRKGDDSIRSVSTDHIDFFPRQDSPRPAPPAPTVIPGFQRE